MFKAQNNNSTPPNPIEHHQEYYESNLIDHLEFCPFNEFCRLLIL